MTIVFSTLLMVGNARGLGYHLWDVTVTDFTGALKMLTVAQWINLPLLAVIKFSCLLSYWRIFKPNQQMRWVLQAAMVLLICAYVGMFFASLFECWPLEKNWEPTISRGHCLKPKGRSPYLSGAINVVSDIVVLVLPIPAIWSLKMRLRRKLRVIAIFSVATLYAIQVYENRNKSNLSSAVIASIIRLAKTSVLYVDRDRTWNIGKIEVWAVLEVNVGLICACSLAFPAFLDCYKGAFVTRFQRCTKFFRSTSNGRTESKRDLASSSLQTPASSTYNRDHAGDKLRPMLSVDTGASEGYTMSNFTIGDTPNSRQHLTRRGDIESDGSLLMYPDKVHVPNNQHETAKGARPGTLTWGESSKS
ncbi:MAG: hypothetical protein Q9213_000989 [Squamulea squamosa]